MSLVKVETILAQAEDLPALSSTATKLIGMLDDMKTTRIEVVKTINLDEVLAASVFKYANSAAVGARLRFINLLDVIDYIGFTSVKNIVLYVAAKKVINDESLWIRSVFITNTYKKIANLLNEPRSSIDLGFMLALFHNLGSLVLRNFYREEFQESSVINDFANRLSKEKQLFGMNHLDLSVIILENWQFPKELIDLVKTQADFGKNSFTKINLIIELARRLFEMEQVDQVSIAKLLSDDKLTKHMKVHGLDKLDLTEDFVNDLFDEARNQISAW
ncbi:MAG: HDOD domain-containing protein [Cyanobacteria bacterium]|nr:HDOD domain-containing protein [Cyanobacteriota bacterium]